MKKWLKLQKGFTLIEMLIVLMIISILLLIAVPNMSKNTKVANEKGCDATIDLLQAQVGVYTVEVGSPPASIDDLEEYASNLSCPDKSKLKLENGKVVKE